MPRIMAALLTWLRDMVIPSSNIPPLINLSEFLVHFPNQLPFIMKGQKFGNKKSKMFERAITTLLIMLHLGVALKWLLDQWFYPQSPPSPTWKIVFIYYCITLFCALTVIAIFKSSALLQVKSRHTYIAKNGLIILFCNS